MAELSALTIPVRVDDSELKRLEQTAKKTGAEINRVGERTISTYEDFNKEIIKSAKNMALWGGVIGSAFAVGGITLFIKTLIDSGKIFEAQASRIGAAFDLTQVQAEHALESIRAKAATIPIPLNDSVKAIEQLERINLGGTQKNLEIVASTALSTGKGIEFITNALTDIRPESLRDLGIELKRTKDVASISFNGMTEDVHNTTQAIREGLLEVIGQKFPDGIERASDTLSGALQITRNLISNLVSGPGSDLNKFLAGVVDRLNDWLEKNGEIITQDVRAFVIGLETSIRNLSSALDILTGDLGDASGASKVFGTSLLALNEGVLLLVKGIAAVKATQLSALQLEKINPFNPGSLLFADELNKKIDQAQTDFNNVQKIVEDIEEQNTRLARGILFPESVKKEMDAARESANNLLAGEKELSAAQAILNRVLGEGKGVADGFGGGISGAADKISASQAAIDSLNDSIIKENDQLIDQIRLIGLEGKKRIEVEAALLKEKGVKSDLVDINKKLKLTQLEYNEQLEKFQKLVDGLPIIEFTRNLGDAENALSNIAKIKFVDTGFGLTVPWIELKETVHDVIDDTKDQLDSLSNYIGSVMANISSTMADAITAGLTGSFDDIKNSWKDMLKSLLNSFLQFVTALALNPVRIGLEAVLGIGGGGGKTAGGKGSGADAAVSTGAGILGSTGSLFGPSGSFTALGALFSGNSAVGFGATLAGALPAIGIILAAAFTAISIILPLLKKTPRLDIDFDQVKTDLEDRAAFVSEFLDEDFFKDVIAKISVKRHAGLGVGGDDAIKSAIQEVIENTIKSVQAIINKLPAELAAELNKQLLNTQVDIDTVVGGERLLEFDAKGKKIREKFEAFINGELQAKFLFAIRDFFQGAFESLGVLPGKASAFIDAEFEKFKNAGSREERAKIGQELLADFNAFVDAFNIVSGNVNDAIGQTIQNVNALASDLGFEAVPSIGELRQELGKLLENAELDPETVQKYADLRNAIVQGILDIGNAISGLIGKIQSLNETIVNFGSGAGIDLGPFLDQAVSQLTDFFVQNVGDLSLSEQEAFLDEIAGFANAQLAQERAAFEAQQAAAQAAAEAQKAVIQGRIDALNKEKDKINEAFKVRIDSLNEELRIAEDFAQLTESIKQTLDSIIFSPESVLTGVEQINLLQSRIADLQSKLATAGTPELQLKFTEELRGTFEQLFSSAGDAFGVNSPEFVAIFDQVTGGLESLADATAARGRSVEEISAEIERLTAENEATLKSIDAKIEAAQNQINTINSQVASNTFKMSAQLEQTFEFLRDEYVRILEERFAELGELTDSGFASELDAVTELVSVSKDQLDQITEQTTVLKNIEELFKNIQSFAGGSGGIQDFGSGKLAVLHGPEAVLTRKQLDSMIQPHAVLPGAFMNYMAPRGESHLVHDVNVNIGGEINVTGDMSDSTLLRFADKLGKSIAKSTKEEITKEIEGGGRLRIAVQSAAKRTL